MPALPSSILEPLWVQFTALLPTRQVHQSCSNCRISCPFGCLAGRSALPLEPGDAGHRGMPKGHQGQATEPTKSAMHEACRPWPAQEPSWLVGRLRLGVGHASTVRPDPSTLGAVGERGSHYESCLQLVPGSASEAVVDDDG